ncbi:hypothetical protein [Candidatus Nucleicultrix amoebiphila]|uniref:Uncharacterized protein n=1 Tax=Candidatus Nucleicultrix amoebiphila FS5 TaxID=1414854 RepID=A0A1W6N564_9PROT|nr:hypothetical protein [Candidatus Nucleicultrix amoebiphila]ARN84941.1 hypothetical protein GQ61_06190 [Candidatus Nucleicultrix amoebiphila FS5]
MILNLTFKSALIRLSFALTFIFQGLLPENLIASTAFEDEDRAHSPDQNRVSIPSIKREVKKDIARQFLHFSKPHNELVDRVFFKKSDAHRATALVKIYTKLGDALFSGALDFFSTFRAPGSTVQNIMDDSQPYLKGTGYFITDVQGDNILIQDTTLLQSFTLPYNFGDFVETFFIEPAKYYYHQAHNHAPFQEKESLHNQIKWVKKGFKTLFPNWVPYDKRIKKPNALVSLLTKILSKLSL